MKADFAMMGDTLAADLSGELDHHAARDTIRELELSIDAALPKNMVLDIVRLF